VLSVAKTHSGTSRRGNPGHVHGDSEQLRFGRADQRTVTVTETVPRADVGVDAGRVDVPGDGGNNCTRTDALMAGQNYPITVT